MKILQERLSFDEAIEALHDGKFVSKKDWIPKGIFLFKNHETVIDLDSVRNPVLNKEFLKSRRCEKLVIKSRIDMWDIDNRLYVGWRPSIHERDGEVNWYIVDPLSENKDSDGVLHVYSNDMKESQREGNEDEDEDESNSFTANAEIEKSKDMFKKHTIHLDLFAFKNEDALKSRVKIDLLKLKQTASAFKIFSSNPEQLEQILIVSERCKGEDDTISYPIIAQCYKTMLLYEEDTVNIYNKNGEIINKFTGGSLMIPYKLIVEGSLVEKTLTFNVLPKTQIYIEFYK